MGNHPNPSGDTKQTREADKIVTKVSENPDKDQALYDAVTKTR